ncbi:MAG: helix-turn-helix transcriptional regulator [Candidatus Edwardsbacteria bacterium]
MENICKKVGERIRLLRIGQGLTQEELAEKAGMNPKYIGQIERGEVNTTVNMLTKIASGMNLNLADLLSFPKTKMRLAENSLVGKRIIRLLQALNAKQLKFVEKTIKNLLHL